MHITRNAVQTMSGPSEWFTGAVYVDPVAVPSEGSRVSASSVHFTPGARTAWHTHPNGQTIYVLEGVGLVQRRGGEIEVIRPGDRVFFEPGEEHWHGAAATRFMTHIALLEVDGEGNTAAWGEHVSDDEYGAAPALDGRARRRAGRAAAGWRARPSVRPTDATRSGSLRPAPSAATSRRRRC